MPPWWATRAPKAQERSQSFTPVDSFRGAVRTPWVGAHLPKCCLASLLAVALIARAWWPARAASAASRSGCRPSVLARRRGRPAAARQAAVLVCHRVNWTNRPASCTRQMGATELTTRRLGARSGPRAMPTAMFPPPPPPPARLTAQPCFRCRSVRRPEGLGEASPSAHLHCGLGRPRGDRRSTPACADMSGYLSRGRLLGLGAHGVVRIAQHVETLECTRDASHAREATRARGRGGGRCAALNAPPTAAAAAILCASRERSPPRTCARRCGCKDHANLRGALGMQGGDGTDAAQQCAHRTAARRAGGHGRRESLHGHGVRRAQVL